MRFFSKSDGKKSFGLTVVVSKFKRIFSFGLQQKCGRIDRIQGWSPPVGEVSPKVTEGLTDRKTPCEMPHCEALLNNMAIEYSLID